MIKFCDLFPGDRFRFLPQGRLYEITEWVQLGSWYAPVSDLKQEELIKTDSPLWNSEVYIDKN